MNLPQALGLGVNGHYPPAYLLPLGLMLTASALWRCCAGRRRALESARQLASRDLELMLICLLLNAAALLAWSLLQPAALLRLWAVHALIGVLPNLLPLWPRSWRWPAAYALLAGGTWLLSA